MSSRHSKLNEKKLDGKDAGSWDLSPKFSLRFWRILAGGTCGGSIYIYYTLYRINYNSVLCRLHRLCSVWHVGIFFRKSTMKSYSPVWWLVDGARNASTWNPKNLIKILPSSWLKVALSYFILLGKVIQFDDSPGSFKWIIQPEVVHPWGVQGRHPGCFDCKTEFRSRRFTGARSRSAGPNAAFSDMFFCVF